MLKTTCGHTNKPPHLSMVHRGLNAVKSIINSFIGRCLQFSLILFGFHKLKVNSFLDLSENNRYSDSLICLVLVSGCMLTGTGSVCKFKNVK